MSAYLVRVVLGTYMVREICKGPEINKDQIICLITDHIQHNIHVTICYLKFDLITYIKIVILPIFKIFKQVLFEKTQFYCFCVALFGQKTVILARFWPLATAQTPSVHYKMVSFRCPHKLMVASKFLAQKLHL